MNEHRMEVRLMGSVFELIVCHEDPSEARRALETGIEEITRIENLLSEFRENTVTTRLNQKAGIEPVEVDPEVYALLERCQQISALTQGAFDISVGPLKKLYRFKNGEFSLPGQEVLNETLQRIGYRHVSLTQDGRKAFLAKKDMHISFAGIGKGYAADRVRKLWIENGISSGVVSASGDLTTIGNKADGSAWKIGIANPDDKDCMLFYIPVTNAAVATSGDYEQYFMHNGVRYSHNINPVTGKPVSGIKSVSVFSPMAELSDALATAVYIMGVDTGIHFIDQLPETHCIIIDEHNKVYHSKKIQIEHEK
jgi:thiamine biosynthesis lipoprotein